ncbi:MAG: hypothetical protein PHY45_08335 [Rhodocyclaceae bacterium]|nr:hypothetical protein [Rhodocyclaceae bacterium]
MNFSGADLTPLGQELLARAAADASDACALMDAATILQFKGNHDLALAMQRQALQLRQHYCLPAQAMPAKLRVLALMAPGDLMANVPLECLVEGSEVDLHLYYVLPGASHADPVPEHDVLFVALSETEDNGPLLDHLAVALADWPRPLLNRPDRIRRVARDEASRTLSGMPGIVMPPTVRMARDALARIAARTSPLDAPLPGGEFPLIVRPLDSHAGHDLQKIDDVAALQDYLAAVAADAFFVSQFVDYRSRDGLFRKYRVALIDGRPFACHMGISSHWMIHYLNAGMADSAEKRAEEAQFMAAFDADFARRHEAALRAVHDGMGLEYVCIDCAETADGRLLIFEVDHAMVVHALDPVDLYPYKQPQMRKVFRAFCDMLGRYADLGRAGHPLPAAAP